MVHIENVTYQCLSWLIAVDFPQVSFLRNQQNSNFSYDQLVSVYLIKRKCKRQKQIRPLTSLIIILLLIQLGDEDRRSVSLVAEVYSDVPCCGWLNEADLLPAGVWPLWTLLSLTLVNSAVVDICEQCCVWPLWTVLSLTFVNSDMFDFYEQCCTWPLWTVQHLTFAWPWWTQWYLPW